MKAQIRTDRTLVYPGSALQGLRPVPLQNPARAFTSTKNDTVDYFWSRASLSNLSSTTRKIDLVFDQVIAQQPVLAAQETDIVFDQVMSYQPSLSTETIPKSLRDLEPVFQ